MSFSENVTGCRKRTVSKEVDEPFASGNRRRAPVVLPKPDAAFGDAEKDCQILLFQPTLDPCPAKVISDSVQRPRNPGWRGRIRPQNHFVKWQRKDACVGMVWLEFTNARVRGLFFTFADLRFCLGD